MVHAAAGTTACACAPAWYLGLGLGLGLYLLPAPSVHGPEPWFKPPPYWIWWCGLEVWGGVWGVGGRGWMSCRA